MNILKSVFSRDKTQYVSSHEIHFILQNNCTVSQGEIFFFLIIFNYCSRWWILQPATRGRLLEAWLVLTIDLEVSKPKRFYGSKRWLAQTMLRENSGQVDSTIQTNER